MSERLENIKNQNIIKSKIPESIDDLLKKFEKIEQPMGKKLKFEGVGSQEVYNTTAPFAYKEKQYLIGRVESPDKDTDSRSIFFEKRETKWSPVEDIPALNLQDPAFTQIDDEFIVSGVKIYPKPSLEFPDSLGYLTVFYRGTDLAKLEEFASGPEQMKDIRIIKLANDKIGVFTRPGDIFSRPKDKIGGMIGYTEIDSLEDLKPENINKAEIIGNLFTAQEWGGANELYLLNNNKIGVLGHIAKINEAGEKEYYAITWEFDLQTREVSNKKIIATRHNFPAGKSKTMEYKEQKSLDYLKHIVFPGGMNIKTDGASELYVGLSDSEEGKIEVAYPFSAPIKAVV